MENTPLAFPVHLRIQREFEAARGSEPLGDAEGGDMVESWGRLKIGYHPPGKTRQLQKGSLHLTKRRPPIGGDVLWGFPHGHFMAVFLPKRKSSKVGGFLLDSLLQRHYPAPQLPDVSINTTMRRKWVS